MKFLKNHKQPPLANRFGKEFSNAVVETARWEYETLIPQIPFIGGAKNRWTSDLIESAQILALFRAMQVHGKTPGETAEVLYEGMQIRFAQYPRFLLRLKSRWQFSSLFIKTLQHQAAETHKHPHLPLDRRSRSAVAHPRAACSKAGRSQLYSYGIR